MSNAPLLKNVIADKAIAIANTGTYPEALAAMRENIASSKAFGNYFGYNSETPAYLDQCAIKAVFQFRKYKVELEKPNAKPIVLPRTIGLKFIAHLSGKTEEEILTEFDDWSKKP